MKKRLYILFLLLLACVFALSACNESHVHEFGEWTTVKDSTCAEEGKQKRVCSCGETETKEIPTKEHEIMTSKQIPPTCDQDGTSEGTYCAQCSEVLSESTVIPAKGYDWILEDGEFKLLMIGNSFTQDASNYSPDVASQLHKILQAMLGDDAKVTIGILVAGDKGMNWHATQADTDTAACSLQVYTTKTPYWGNKGMRTHAEALQWTDWDIVSLQPYGVNTETGIESNNFPAETNLKFSHISNSLSYLLDLVHNNAPQAEVFCYMHWVNTTTIALDAGLSKYNQMAELYPTFLEYEGTETGKRFTSLIPVGQSIQNARTTYLSLLAYNTSAYLDKTLNYKTDGQLGLQRDQGHLSYNVGRYVAALTFAEMLIPTSLRAENYALPSIRKTESIGDLPEEYSTIAQKAVLSAVESWKAGKLSVTDLSLYKKDPTTVFAESFEGGLPLRSNYPASMIKQTVEDTINAQCVQDLIVEKIEFPDTITPGTDFEVSVTVRFGYTTLEFAIDCIF